LSQLAWVVSNQRREKTQRLDAARCVASVHVAGRSQFDADAPAPNLFLWKKHRREGGSIVMTTGLDPTSPEGREANRLVH
jgi:hypothetical protein